MRKKSGKQLSKLLDLNNARHILSFNLFSPVANKTSDSSTAADESFQETNETSTFTEVYGGESLEMIRKASKNGEKLQIEVASRIVWTTPRTVLEMTKETSTETPRGEKNSYWDTEANEFQETSNPAINAQNESIGKVIICIVISLTISNK